MKKVCVFLHSILASPTISPLYVVSDDRGRPRSGATQPLPGESDFLDSSEPLFSMYSKIAEEDNKIAEGWKTDADGILIFVSPRAPINTHTTLMNRNTIDWSLLGGCRCAACGDCSGPEAKLPGYLRILSRKYLAGSFQPGFISCIIPFHLR